MRLAVDSGRVLDEGCIALGDFVHLHYRLIDLGNAVALFATSLRDLDDELVRPSYALDNVIHCQSGLPSQLAARTNLLDRDVDQRLDLVRRGSAPMCQRAYFGSNDSEAAPCSPARAPSTAAFKANSPRLKHRQCFRKIELRKLSMDFGLSPTKD